MDSHLVCCCQCLLRADPACCLVIEGSATGLGAGLYAGATVWGYCAAGYGRAFEGLRVARVFRLPNDTRPQSLGFKPAIDPGPQYRVSGRQ